MEEFFTADLHLGHGRIIAHIPHLYGPETFNLSMDVGVDSCGLLGFRPYCPIHESDIEVFMQMRRERMEAAGRVLHGVRTIYLQDDVEWMARFREGRP